MGQEDTWILQCLLHQTYNSSLLKLQEIPLMSFSLRCITCSPENSVGLHGEVRVHTPYCALVYQMAPLTCNQGTKEREMYNL